MCETLRSIGPVQPRSYYRGNGREPARRLPSNNLVKKPKQAGSPHERQAKAQGDDCLRPHLNQAGFNGCRRGSVRILRRRLDLMHTSDKSYHVRSVVGLNRWSSWRPATGGTAQSPATSSNTLTPPSCLSFDPLFRRPKGAANPPPTYVAGLTCPAVTTKGPTAPSRHEQLRQCNTVPAALRHFCGSLRHCTSSSLGDA
jgi:hypothetical protein